MIVNVRPFLLSAFLTAFAVSVNSNEMSSVLLNDRSRAIDAVAQLVRSQLPSGFFPYDFNFSNGVQSDMGNVDGVNLVRQTAAAFSLAEYHATFPAQHTRKSLERFLKHVRSSSVPIGKGPLQRLLEQLRLYNRWQLWQHLREPFYDMGLLFSKEGKGRLVSVDGDYERAWPGATALSLIAAIKYYRSTNETQFNQAIQWWKDGLFALHVPGRGFREAPHYLSESAYANGQAWLALAEYVATFPMDEDARLFLDRLDDYILEQYSKKPDKRFYHWGTMAASVRAADTGDSRFAAFMVELATSYIEELRQPKETNSCPSVEGLATFVVFMTNQGRGNESVVSQAIHIIETLMAVNRKLQISANSVNVLDVEENYLYALDKYRGAFLLSLREPVMQVDLTGHCLDALVRMDQAGLTQ